MSVEMMENEHLQHDKQELRQYRGLGFGGQMRIATNHDHNAGDHQGMRIKPHDHQSNNNKHSYFLRAKTPRFLGFHHVGEDDGEFKKPSPINREGIEREKSSSSFLPSPRSKTDTPLIHEHPSLSEEEDLANCLVMLSKKSSSHGDEREESNSKGKEVVEKGTFQCKACKKVFNSHQALGGHRASHKKVKGCFASKIDGLNDDESLDDIQEPSMQEDQEPHPPPPEPDTALRPVPSARKRTKMHECSVCRRVFSSGQALGGHKRCHWLTTSTDNAFIPNFHDFQYDHRSQQLCKKPPLFTTAKPHHLLDHEHEHEHDHDQQLDLNLNLPPAPQHDRKRDNGGDDNDNDNDGVHDGDRTSKCEASTRLCLQQWTDQNQLPKPGDGPIDRGGEEACEMKLRKLSDLRDVNLDGGWLQMGIPSTSEMR
ncbi:uncharacterized protein LOC131004374 [Salvia miltiorrhiza]|uniref:uncharacterized protein LOC131004374 n=1 Tax=Salvia miltiorrhiza TaxID=226208 RepID=UPI0025AC7355|nr:uncharacterized protein LOC131004374 [Salvia miltiorrhiza]